MSAKRSRPSGGSRAARKSWATDKPNTTTGLDFDRQIVDRVDASIWQALFDGHFRLATKCSVCGRWLTAYKSKQNNCGPRCAAKNGSAAR